MYGYGMQYFVRGYCNSNSKLLICPSRWDGIIQKPSQAAVPLSLMFCRSPDPPVRAGPDHWREPG